MRDAFGRIGDLVTCPLCRKLASGHVPETYDLEFTTVVGELIKLRPTKHDNGMPKEGKEMKKKQWIIP
ncbi:MAG: hypothetical protein CMB97_01765 [Flavobacteriaceae bacterium]|nr:hypothetical protein [Flavobacteriaceae bacterium]